MKRDNRSHLSSRKSALVEKSRWVAYATVSATTAIVGSRSLEGAIHYSGLVNETFPPDRFKTHRFPLDQAGNYLFFERVFRYSNLAAFSIAGMVSGRFRAPNYYYVSKLASGQNVSAGSFHSGLPNFHGIMARSINYAYAQWNDAGTGYIGFQFNNRSGVQYGWVRVKMAGLEGNPFKVLDYAYADPGEPIRTGQRSSDVKAPTKGSLGWPAAGAVGLLVWRKTRSQIQPGHS